MKLPVRTEIEVLSADDPTSRTLGLVMYEKLGTAAYSPGYLAGLTRWSRFKNKARNWWAKVRGHKPTLY